MFFFSVSVLCVLCVFVVKSFSVAVLHRTRIAAARMSTTPCLLGARYSHDVMHQFRAFSPLLASLISVGNLAEHYMINRNVIKCHHSYGQLPSSALWHPT